jgi:hypothetical protein
MISAMLTKVSVVEGDDSCFVAEAVKKRRLAKGEILRSQMVESTSTCSSVGG